MRKLIGLIGISLVTVAVCSVPQALPMATIPVVYASPGPGEEILRPSDNGTFTGWTAFGATNNWQCVNEVTPDGDDSYVTTTADNVTDSYNLQDHTTGTGTISNVRVYIRAEAAAGKEIILAVVVGGTKYDAAAGKTLTTKYVDYYDDWAQNPATSTAWTWDDIDALEVSFASGVLANKEERVTTAWVVVTYTPPVSIDITPPSAIIGWELSPSASQPVTQNGTLVVTITGGPASWSVTAQDSNATTNGHMTEWDGSYNPANKLQMPMWVAAPPDYNVELPTGGEIATGTTSENVTVTFKQEVVFSDEVKGYRIVVTFIGTL